MHFQNFKSFNSILYILKLIRKFIMYQLLKNYMQDLLLTE